MAAQAAKAATQQEHKLPLTQHAQPRSILANPLVQSTGQSNRGWEQETRDWRPALGNQSTVASRQFAADPLTTDTGVDTDGDTLSDFTEERVGSYLPLPTLMATASAMT